MHLTGGTTRRLLPKSGEIGDQASRRRKWEIQGFAAPVCAKLFTVKQQLNTLWKAQEGGRLTRQWCGLTLMDGIDNVSRAAVFSISWSRRILGGELLSAAGSKKVFCYLQVENASNVRLSLINASTKNMIFRAERQLSLIPLNRTATLPASLSNLTRPR